MKRRNDNPTTTPLLLGLCTALLLGATSAGCGSSSCPSNDSPDATTTDTGATSDHQAGDAANGAVDSGVDTSAPDGASDTSTPDAPSAAHQKMCQDDCKCSQNKPKCEQQCLKELGGVGYLYQPIALDMFGWWQNNPDHCGDSWAWEHARYSDDTQEAYDRVMNLDESEMQPCLDFNSMKAGMNIKWKLHMYCFENYYMFNEPIRKEIRDCWAIPNRATADNCAVRVSGNLTDSRPWFVRY